ncbi:MAG: IS110 family transposase [Pseudonocardiaceae bacterium]
MLFVGDDWAEDHHDVEVVDESGCRLARKRFSEGVTGFAGLHALLADCLPDDAEPADVVIGIETDRGPWVTALIAAGYRVFAINPMQASRYRERYSTSGAKSDRGDAHVLAEIVRLDRAHHRQVAGDSDLSEAIKVLARSHQNLIWSRQRQTNQLRSMLREYYPAALEAFPDLAGRDALAVLAAAPTPEAGRALTLDAIIDLLQRAGRRRYRESTATKIHSALHAEQLAALPLTTRAFGASARALVTVITALTTEISVLQDEVDACFGQHPDAEIYLSQPGLGTILAARVLAEFGDDPERYVTGKSRKNYAGTSPITRASGTKTAVLARYARNRRIGDALFQQAFCALTTSPGARACYDTMRARGIGHNDALRRLANRLVGILHGCLRHHTPYNEAAAWPTTSQDQQPAA